MEVTSSYSMGAGERALFWLTVSLAAWKFIDFTFYGLAARNLLAAVGFTLMAIAGSRGAFRWRHTEGVQIAARDRYISWTGIALVVMSFVMRWTE